MNKLLITILASFLLGCGQANTTGQGQPTAPTNWPNDFTVHVEAYRALATKHSLKTSKKRNKALTIVWGEFENPKTIARCDLDLVKVTINKQWWDQRNHYGQRYIVFHELAHCIHLMSHRGQIINGKTTSIMYPKTISQENYEKDQEYYDNELFTGAGT